MFIKGQQFCSILLFILFTPLQQSDGYQNSYLFTAMLSLITNTYAGLTNRYHKITMSNIVLPHRCLVRAVITLINLEHIAGRYAAG